nr:WD repeat-containing protein 3 [Cryptomonas paramecium]
MKHPFCFKTSFGDVSNCVHSLFFPKKTKNSNVVFLFKKESFFLWNMKHNFLIASFFKISKKWRNVKKADVCYISKLKTVIIGIGFDDGCIHLWKVNVSKSIVCSMTLLGHSHAICCLKLVKNNFSIISSSEMDIIVWNFFKKNKNFKIQGAHDTKIRLLISLTLKDASNLYILSLGFDNKIKIWKIKKKITSKLIFVREKNISDLTYIFNKNLLILISQRSEINFYQISSNLKLFSIAKFWKGGEISDYKLFINENMTYLFIKTNKHLSVFPFRDIYIFLFHKDNKMLKFRSNKTLFKPFVLFFNFRILGIDLQKSDDNNSLMVLIHYNTHVVQVYKFFKLRLGFNKNKFFFQKIFKMKIEYHKSEIREVKWLKNSYSILNLCGISKQIYIWCLYSKKLLHKISTISQGLCFVLCNKKNVVLGTKLGKIEIYDLVSKKILFVYSKAHKGPIWSIDITKNSFLVSTTGSDSSLKLWELEFSKISILKTLNSHEQILSAKMICSKNIIIICGLSSKISMFQLDSLKFVFHLEGHTLPVICTAITNYNILASGSVDSSFRLWDIDRKIQKKVVKTSFSAITSIEFQKHTSNLFVASRCGSILYWKDVNFNFIYEVKKCHTGPIWTLKCSGNGNFLASGSKDRHVKIWKINQLDESDTSIFSFKKNEHYLFFLEKLKVYKNKTDFFEHDTTFRSFDKKNKTFEFLISSFFLNLKKKEINRLYQKFNSRKNLNVLTKVIDLILKNKKTHPLDFHSLDNLFYFSKLLKKNYVMNEN